MPDQPFFGLVGAFLVFLGICFVYAPAAIWPYAIAGFLILVGLWIFVKGSFIFPDF